MTEDSILNKTEITSCYVLAISAKCLLFGIVKL